MLPLVADSAYHSSKLITYFYREMTVKMPKHILILIKGIVLNLILLSLHKHFLLTLIKMLIRYELLQRNGREIYREMTVKMQRYRT